MNGVAAARDLRGVMPGRVLLPDDIGYSSARQIWNGAVDHRPALFAQCETHEDVGAAVRAARRHLLPLSVRGGGHDWTGRSLRPGGLVVDLSAMRQVSVDAQARVATIGGGATARDVIAAAAPYGLVAVTGNCGAVGMAGLTLGGGYGVLSARYGLALDNLLGADIILADGRRITADALEHPDLFWALRGGGGNFGVVTSLRIRLHPLRELLAGLILFPWSDAEPVLRGYTDVMASASDDLGVLAGVLSAPDGSPAVFLAPTWCGAPTDGTGIMTRLQNLGTPILAQVGPMNYGALLDMFDAHIVNGRHHAIQTRWLTELTPRVIAELVRAGRARTSTFAIIALHHLHGAAVRVPSAATAFALRREHFLVEVIAGWEPGDAENGAVHRQWAQMLSRTLATDALPGGYPNLLGPDEHDQISRAYGTNTGRLRAVKQRFDPEDVFSAISLPS